MTKPYRVSAFPANDCGGNPAGVVPGADSLSDEEMQRIAKEIGYSETAFIMESSRADFKVRFFTPVEEVDLCGHATIATFNLLRDLGTLPVGRYTQETKAGILEVEVDEDRVFMEQNPPEFHEVLTPEEISRCFDLAIDRYCEDMPVQIVTTGLRDIILPVKGLASLNAMKADRAAITLLSEKYDTVGIHAFCRESLEGADAHARNFAPRYGIEEESATGTSSGALACYLTRYGGGRWGGSFEFEQGYAMGRPSRIHANVKADGNHGINSVYVGGGALRIGDEYGNHGSAKISL